MHAVGQAYGDHAPLTVVASGILNLEGRAIEDQGRERKSNPRSRRLAALLAGSQTNSIG